MKYLTKIYAGDEYTRNCFRIQIFATDMCNYSCEYCYNKKPRQNINLDLTKLQYLIEYVKSKKNQQIHVELIGGEPTLHPGLHEFCKHLKRIKINCTIYTNFSQAFQYYNELMALGNVDIIATYHYCSSKQTDDYISKAFKLDQQHLMNRKVQFKIMFEIDHFENSLKVFDMLQQTYLHKCLNMSLLDRNSDGSILFYASRKTYSQAQMNQYYERANKIVSYTNNLIAEYSDKTKKSYFYNDFANHNIPNFKYWYCNAGYDYLYVHNDGNIYACCQLKDFFLGNIYSKIVMLRNHPMICLIDQCPCKYDIYKEKVFK